MSKKRDPIPFHLTTSDKIVQNPNHWPQMGIKYLFILVVLFVSYQVVQHEMHKYQVLLHECQDQRQLDQRLLFQDICSDPESRADFEGKGMVDCRGAQDRLRVSPNACAASKWRSTSEVAHIYNMFTRSYFSLMGLLALVASAGVWYAWKTRRDDQLLHEYRKTVQGRMDDGPIMRLKAN